MPKLMMFVFVTYYNNIKATYVELYLRDFDCLVTWCGICFFPSIRIERVKGEQNGMVIRPKKRGGGRMYNNLTQGLFG